jgi:hypothetical protein
MSKKGIHEQIHDVAYSACVVTRISDALSHDPIKGSKEKIIYAIPEEHAEHVEDYYNQKRLHSRRGYLSP